MIRSLASRWASATAGGKDNDDQANPCEVEYDSLPDDGRDGLRTSSRHSIALFSALVFVSLAPTRVEAGRQGGDTIESAVPISSLPYSASGTTVGFANDYDESCPYPGVSPDVVYELVPEYDLLLTVDLWGSDYDTKVWIWDANFNLVECNDDYYWENYESKIVAAPLLGGAVYYIVVDGHTNDQGNYVMNVQEYEACEISCHGDAVLEGEPTLIDGYIDALNGGCTSMDLLGYAPYQRITSPVFCAVSGWYDSPGPIDWDIDWFEFVIPQDGYLDISIETELLLRVYESNPQDCDNIWYGNPIDVAGCSERTMTVLGEPGDLVWILVRPSFERPGYFEGNEFDYVVRSNLESQVRVESHSWSDVRSIFR